jgi:hypothetical protein
MNTEEQIKELQLKVSELTFLIQNISKLIKLCPNCKNCILSSPSNPSIAVARISLTIVSKCNLCGYSESNPNPDISKHMTKVLKNEYQETNNSDSDDDQLFYGLYDF